MRDHLATAGVFPVPQKVENTTLDSHAGEGFADKQVIMNDARSVVAEHPFAKIVQALAAREPSRGDHKRQVARFEFLGLLNEKLVNRRGARAASTTAVSQLIGRISDD